MQKLVIATSNQNKIREIKEQLGELYNFLSLTDIGCMEDIPETQPTIEGNAIQKAQYVYDKYGYNCFAEDTGLIVEAVNGEPGVYSARYAGPQRNHEDNMNKLLTKLGDNPNRQAYFKTVIALVIDGKETLFEGIVEGEILKQRQGEKGFGYDPIFKPNGFEKSFAQMTSAAKSTISHRGRATAKLAAFLIK
jgi:XTP/dITP diphosphohydrolase